MKRKWGKILFSLLLGLLFTLSPETNCSTSLAPTFPWRESISVFQGVMLLLLTSPSFSDFSFSIFFSLQKTLDSWPPFSFYCAPTSCLSSSLLPLNTTIIPHMLLSIAISSSPGVFLQLKIIMWVTRFIKAFGKITIAVNVSGISRIWKGYQQIWQRIVYYQSKY